jgi:CysZ protein
MILEAARLSILRLPSAPYRGVLLKSLGLTLVLLLLAWLGLKETFDWLALPLLETLLPEGAGWSGWVSAFAGLLAGIAIAVGLALLVAPVTALIAGVFLDDVAELVEQADYPGEPPGRAMPFARSIVASLKFFGVVVAANLAALLLLLVPGINLVAFLLVNGYLLGREYFEFAAMRHRTEAEARAFRRANRGTVFLGGLVIAVFLAVPILNLATPLFAATLMVHIHKMLSGSVPEPSS